MLQRHIALQSTDEATIAAVKEVLTIANIDFTVEESHIETVILGFSGNTAELTINLKIVSSVIVVEFTGIGGYYTDYGLAEIERIVHEKTYLKSGKLDWDSFEFASELTSEGRKVRVCDGTEFYVRAYEESKQVVYSQYLVWKPRTGTLTEQLAKMMGAQPISISESKAKRDIKMAKTVASFDGKLPHQLCGAVDYDKGYGRRFSR